MSLGWRPAGVKIGGGCPPTPVVLWCLLTRPAASVTATNVLSTPRIRRFTWAAAARISGVAWCNPTVQAMSSAADGMAGLHVSRCR